MIVKGRYVGLIEVDFKVILGEGDYTFDEFRTNINQLNSNIENELEPLIAENSDDIFSTMKVTQQYLDVYQVEEQP